MAHPLPATICNLVSEGKLPAILSTKDVFECLRGEFPDKYLRVVLANNCEGTGNYVKRGQKAWFRRVSRGLYEIISTS
jgi:hypothetical protein